MDGKSHWRDSFFVECIWRTIKYEEVSRHACTTESEARTSIPCYLKFYNSFRPYTSLKALMPDQEYFDRVPVSKAAQTENETFT